MGCTAWGAETNWEAGMNRLGLAGALWLVAAGFAVNVNQLPGGPGIVLEQSSTKAPKGATITLYVF